MKVYGISDFHLSINTPKPMDIFGEVWSNYLDEIALHWESEVDEDDVVLIAGDISWAMKMEDVVPDLEYLGKYKGKKVLLRGNHDYWWHSISALRKILPQNMYAVQNDCLRFDKLLVCGTRGWTTPENKIFSEEDKRIYDRELIRLKLSLDEMDKVRKVDDNVIIMMHFPPFNSKFDASPFTDLIRMYAPDRVVYGHLHGKNVKVRPLVNIGGVEYILTSCDLVNNKLVRII